MNIMLAYKNKMESRKQHFQNDRNSQSGLASNKIPQKSKKVFTNDIIFTL